MEMDVPIERLLEAAFDGRSEFGVGEDHDLVEPGELPDDIPAENCFPTPREACRAATGAAGEGANEDAEARGGM